MLPGQWAGHRGPSHTVATRPNVIPRTAAVWWDVQPTRTAGRRAQNCSRQAEEDRARAAAIMTHTSVESEIIQRPGCGRCAATRHESRKLFPSARSRAVGPAELGTPGGEDDLPVRWQAKAKVPVGGSQAAQQSTRLPARRAEDRGQHAGEYPGKVPMVKFYFPGSIPRTSIFHPTGAAAFAATSIAHRARSAGAKGEVGGRDRRMPEETPHRGRKTKAATFQGGDPAARNTGPAAARPP